MVSSGEVSLEDMDGRPVDKESEYFRLEECKRRATLL